MKFFIEVNSNDLILILLVEFIREIGVFGVNKLNFRN